VKKSGFSSQIPSGIVITGGGAKTVGISESARRSVALPFRVGAPYEIKGVTDEVITPAFATAVGLVKYGIKMEQKDEGFTLFKLPQFVKGNPLKGTASKIVDLVKSFLP
jgi:cell division protein FtsA